MQITEAQLCAVMPNLSRSNAAIFSPVLCAACAEFGLKQPEAIAMFIAQIAHESSELSRVIESLNYSADRLREIWPTRFNTPELAASYARKPQQIANYVYGKRMGNCLSDDGWRYRGRGLIQVTGRENYAMVGGWLGVDLLASPDYLETPTGAARSAAAFFAKKTGYHGRTAQQWALLCDLASCTRSINGGLLGLGERSKFYSRARKVFGIHADD